LSAIRLLWPGASEPTQFLVSELQHDVQIVDEGKEHMAARGFHIFYSKRTGGRFTQQANFISDLEEIVPSFYGSVGANLTTWKKSAPKIKPDKPSAEDVTPDAISEEAEGFES